MDMTPQNLRNLATDLENWASSKREEVVKARADSAENRALANVIASFTEELEHRFDDHDKASFTREEFDRLFSALSRKRGLGTTKLRPNTRYLFEGSEAFEFAYETAARLRSLAVFLEFNA